jgi:hypothetical protein
MTTAAPTPPLLASTTRFQQDFADGLAAMLAAHRSLGVYILVLANAAYDSALWAQLESALAARHAELADAVAATLRRGSTLAEPDDDVMVFLKLNTIGFAHLGRMEGRRDGAWQAMFNPLRALRPPRASGQTYAGLLRPFDAAGFHFNKPFLEKEILWSGQLGGKEARLLYNKFPFARLHGLLVPEPGRGLPQYLTPELHGWAWDLCAASGLPGLALGYNSAGAGASVNHLHFQSFVQADGLPVQDARFVHNGGAQPYPLPCTRLADREQAWLHLDALHQRNQPYNLVYARDVVYCIARLPQDSAALQAACRGYGWSEMAGVVTLFSRESHAAWTAAGFESELARFAP